MRKRKAYATYKRMLAVLLAVVLAFSTFQDASIVGYASETEGEGGENGDISGGDATVSEGDGQGSTYLGTEETEEERSGLKIDAWDMEAAGETFSEEAIVSILNARKEAGETFEFLNINFNSVTDSVSVDVWNAAVEVLQPGNGSTLRFNFAGGESVDENWSFHNPTVAESNLNTGLTFTIGEEGKGVSMQFDSIAFPAESVGISFCHDEGKSSEYSNFKAALENITYFEIVDANGKIAETFVSCNVDENFTWMSLDIQNIKVLTAGTTYTAQQGVYRGRVDSWTEDSGYECNSLNIIPGEADETSFSVETILQVLAAHDGESFDEIYVESSEGEANVIAADVINAAVELLKQSEERENCLKFGFVNETEQTFKEWHLMNASANQEADQTVSATISISENNEVSVGVSTNTFSAARTDVLFGARTEGAFYNTYKNIFGENETELAVGEVADGWYWIDDYNAYIRVHNTTRLAEGQTYTVTKQVYLGNEEEEDGNAKLVINSGDVYDRGGEFNDATIISILQARAKEEKTYAIIEINYPSNFDSVSAEVWNTALGLLTPDCEHTSLRFNGCGETVMDKCWNIDNPQTTESAISLSATATLLEAEQGIELSFANVNIPAEGVFFHVYTDNNRTDREALQAALGNLSLCKILDSEGNVVENVWVDCWSDEDADGNSWVGFDMGSVTNLTANTTYVIKQTEYTGDINSWTEDDGSERTNLLIHPANLGKDSFTEEELLAIINANAGKKFNMVTIASQNAETKVIDKDVVNAAVALLEAPSEEVGTVLLFNFRDNETGIGQVWQLNNPTADQTTDQTVFASLAITENDEVTVSVNEYSFHADSVDVILSADSGTVMSNSLRDIFGEEERNLTIGEELTRGWYYADEEHVEVNVYDTAKLTANQAYQVTRAVYLGEEEDDGSKLVIRNEAVYDNSEEFNDAAIISILRARAEKGKTYKTIEINYPSITNTISADVWNTLVGLLTPECESRTLLFGNWGDTGADLIWNMENPVVTESDVKLGVTINIGEAGKGIGLQFANVNIPADGLMLHIYTHSDRADAAKLQAAFVDTETMRFEVLDSEGNVVESSDFWVNPWSNKYEDGSYEIGFDTGNIKNLTSGVVYTINPVPYTGDVYSWTDEAGEVRYGLDINPICVGKNKYTTSEILNLFEVNKAKIYDEICIHYFEQDSVIAKDIVNASAEMLREANEAFAPVLKFIFWGGEKTPGVGYTWTLYNPSAYQTEDVAVSSSLAISESKEVTISVDANVGAISADWIDAGFIAENPTTLNANLKSIFGEQSKLLMLGDEVIWAWYQVDDNAVELRAEDVASLTINQKYAVTEPVYHGHIEETPYGLFLFISAYDMGKENFVAGEVESILKYHLDKGNTFHRVLIEEAHTANDVIKKDYINAARKLLVETEEVEKAILFLFCAGEQGDYYKYNDIGWGLYNPGEADADINANVVVTPGVNGLTIKMAAKEFNAEDVHLQFLIDTSFAKATEWLNSTGQPNGENLAVLDSEMNFYGDVEAKYSISEETTLDLDIYGMQYLEADKEYLFAPVKNADKLFVVGEAAKLNVSKPVDNGTQISWCSYNENVAQVSESGEVTAKEAGDVYISAFYQSGGVSCIEMWHGYANYELRKIVFDKTELTMELPPEGEDWECMEYLQVKWYPANAATPQERLTWTTSDASVVELVTWEDGVVGGEIKAVAPGTATIRATYDEQIYAECKVTVVKPVEVPGNAWPERLYIITNFATKLSDAIGLPEGWKWENPDMSLTPFKDMDGHAFPASYTAADGRTTRITLWVEIITISGVSIEAIELLEDGCAYVEKPVALMNGQSVVLNWDVISKNGDSVDLSAYGERVKVQWSSNPAGIGTQDGLEGYWKDSYKFTADATNAGVKTFTLSLVDSQTGKLIAKDSYKLTVTEKEVIDFYSDMSVEMVEESETSGKLHFRISKDKYYKLTLKSSDTSVLVLGAATVEETADGIVDTVVPYTFKKTGSAYIIVTADDEIKSSVLIKCFMIDSEPEVAKKNLSINKALVEKTDTFTIRCEEAYPIADNSKVVLSGEYAGKFSLETTEINGGVVTFALRLTDKSLKKGTYKVDVKIPVLVDETTNATKEYTYQLKVKIIENLPKITIKQTQKVNLFYTDKASAGILTISAKEALVTDVILGDYVDSKNSAKNAACDYTLEQLDENSYLIILKQNAKGTAKKGTLSYKLAGYDGTFTKTITVQTTTKAPTLVLHEKSTTLYPKLGYSMDSLVLTDKATGELVCFEKVSWVKSKNVTQEITAEGIEAQLKKNTYTVSLSEDSDWNTIIFFKVNTENAGTDKIEIQVKAANWSQPLTVKYSMKVVTKEPSLKLASKKLTLNKNAAIFDKQMVTTALWLDGGITTLAEDMTHVRFVGADEKSSKILNESLVLEYRGDRGEIVARFNDNTLDKGAYKYKVQVESGNYKAETVLTINIVDIAPEKNIKVSKKGSIDVLDRENTYIAYSAKIKNMTGFVIDAYLTGTDSTMFNTYCDENGQLIVQAWTWEAYSTKNTYKVQPVFVIYTEDYGTYEVKAPVQSIKVKQSKPKITVSAESNVLYADAENELYINVEATLKNQEVEIADVKLLNYTDDLCLKGMDVVSPDGFAYHSTYDGVNNRICLSRYAENEILKSGKTWKLKLQVKYRDKAGNEKDCIVTYKVVVK